MTARVTDEQAREVANVKYDSGYIRNLALDLLDERAKVAALTAALEVVGDMRNSHLAARDCTWEGDRMYAVNPFIFERILRCASDALALAGTATDARLRSPATKGSSPEPKEREAAPRTALGECARDEIGDDCRCDECEERKRAEIERQWEIHTEREL